MGWEMNVGQHRGGEATWEHKEFLTAVEDRVNKVIQKTVRRTRESMAMQVSNDFGQMNWRFNLIFAGYKAPTGKIVKEAFINNFLWPLDFVFMEYGTQKEVTHGSNPELHSSVCTIIQKSKSY